MQGKVSEQIITFKYDGKSDSIKKHQIDVRLLAASLESFADLIALADEAIHLRDSATHVQVKADFIPGSFGIELVVLTSPEVMKALGLVGAAIGGGLFSLLNELRGRKVEVIEIEEDDDLAEIVLAKGEVLHTPKEVAKLLGNEQIRQKIDKLVYQPLSNEGIDSFSLFSGSGAGEEDVPLIEVSEVEGRFFRKPPAIQKRNRESITTEGKVEFVAANKQSGTSGWRMNYLGYSDVSVKIKDDIFLARIQDTDSPAIFAEKFNVKLLVKKTFVHDEVVNVSFEIEKVLGPF